MSSIFQQFRTLERWYGECYKLYTKTWRMFTCEENKDIFNVITLSMLKNKVSDSSMNTIVEMLETRMNDLRPSDELLKTTDPKSIDRSLSESSSSQASSGEEGSLVSPGEPRELKILLAGDVDAGKTSVLNVLMGGRYLPSYSTRTTSVPCEIHNSNKMSAQIHFGKDECKNIELSSNASDKCWKVLGEAIKQGEQNSKPVHIIKIFWPFRILRAEQSWVNDPENTFEKQRVGTNPDPDDDLTTSERVVPVVFMDLPGLLDHGTAQVLECIPEYRNFIIVIDCSTEIKHTLTDLLRDIQDKICKHGGIFNPTSVLFLLNRMDLLDADPSKVPRETEILKIIQTIWPVVIASQLHMVSCRKMLKGKGHLGGFKDTICNFIELTNRRNLEEHCYWLTKLLEGIAAYFGTGYNWLSFDKCLEGIKEHADHDYKCLQKEIERLLNGKSQFYRNLLEAAKVRKAGLRVLLKTAIQNRLEDTDVYRTLLAALETRLCHNLRRDYESTKDSLVDGLRCGIKKQLKLVEHAKDDNASLENVVVRNEITVAVGRLVMTHLALVQKPIRTIEEEVQFIRHREMDINAVIDYLADWCEKQADIERQQMIQSLKSQSEMRLSIKNTHSMNQTANTSKYRQVSDIADHSVKKLYKIYVEDVLMHEYRGSFEEASKDWYVRYRKGKSPTSGGLPQHTDIYREMTMLRALSEKEKAEQEKKSHFLLLQGTSSLVQEHSHVLAIGMERCDVSLNDVILSLQDEDREIWELDNGRKRTEYALGAVKGLQFMHENGFVHRDVKPHNFLVKYGYDGANDTVKICAIGHTEEMANMQTGYGTRQYCAPEVVTSEAYSFKADIYSLGLVLWEMWYCAKLSCEPGKTPSLEPEPEGVFGGSLSQCLQTCPANRPDSSYIIGELEKQLIAA